jgi:undecaprenyl pyrophosphate synthase
MTLRKNVALAFDGYNEMAFALSMIAVGHTDADIPITDVTAQRIAREALSSCGLDPDNVLKVRGEMRDALAKTGSG